MQWNTIFNSICDCRSCSSGSETSIIALHPRNFYKEFALCCGAGQFVHNIQVYFTGTGAIVRLPSAIEVTLKDIGKWITSPKRYYIHGNAQQNHVHILWGNIFSCSLYCFNWITTVTLSIAEVGAYFVSMMTSSNGNIFRVTGPLFGIRWIPRTKASDAELWCFLWSAPN